MASSILSLGALLSAGSSTVRTVDVEACLIDGLVSQNLPVGDAAVKTALFLCVEKYGGFTSLQTTALQLLKGMNLTVTEHDLRVQWPMLLRIIETLSGDKTGGAEVLSALYEFFIPLVNSQTLTASLIRKPYRSFTHTNTPVTLLALVGQSLLLTATTTRTTTTTAINALVRSSNTKSAARLEKTGLQLLERILRINSQTQMTGEKEYFALSKPLLHIMQRRSLSSSSADIFHQCFELLGHLFAEKNGRAAAQVFR